MLEAGAYFRELCHECLGFRQLSTQLCVLGLLVAQHLLCCVVLSCNLALELVELHTFMMSFRKRVRRLKQTRCTHSATHSFNGGLAFCH